MRAFRQRSTAQRDRAKRRAVLAAIALSVLMLLLLAPGPHGQSVLTAAIDRYRGTVARTSDAYDATVEETSPIFSTDPETASADAAGAFRHHELLVGGILDGEQATLFGEAATLGLIDAAHDGSLEARNDAVGEIIRDFLSEGLPGPSYGQPSNYGFGGSAKGGYAAGDPASGGQGAGGPLSGAFGAASSGGGDRDAHGELTGDSPHGGNEYPAAPSDGERVVGGDSRGQPPVNDGGTSAGGNAESVRKDPGFDFILDSSLSGNPDDNHVSIYPSGDAPPILPIAQGDSSGGLITEGGGSTSDATIAAVPEPTSLGLLGSGLVLVARMLRARRRA